MLMIIVQPPRALRVEMARWAVQQTPKVRTCSTTEFAVPAHLFTHIPEEVLAGSVVDGQRYISPDPQPEPAAVVAPGPADPPQETLHTAPDNPHTAHTTPLTTTPDTTTPDSAPYPCGACPREFTTQRGRDMHRRQAHPEVD
ncbi:hypothetical protein [Nonomuraea turcica]|uniref:hypothetical protein n=1 Tax=Nonomuraea sp. G32 TaxID=3067274 RepID=UPI00273B18F7|nr:hypothetical protein [Nonomuraea sp. G32]MDP4501059.1 hypothetical protein [Nonomuraea sp. G32]